MAELDAHLELLYARERRHGFSACGDINQQSRRAIVRADLRWSP